MIHPRCDVPSNTPMKEGVDVMNAITKFAAKAALVGSLAIAAVAATSPADAGVRIGIGLGVGGPVYAGGFCNYHPYQCGYGYNVAYAGPQVGVFYGGRGWWDGHRYFGHRTWGHGGWRFR
jgi:hypothetical protein